MPEKCGYVTHRIATATEVHKNIRLLFMGDGLVMRWCDDHGDVDAVELSSLTGIVKQDGKRWKPEAQ